MSEVRPTIHRWATSTHVTQMQSAIANPPTEAPARFANHRIAPNMKSVSRSAHVFVSMAPSSMLSKGNPVKGGRCASEVRRDVSDAIVYAVTRAKRTRV
jgi:hypothetical protein